jgi:hypothetical protein
MKNRIASLDNLMLQVGKRATVASVSALRPHLIVNATGSTPCCRPLKDCGRTLTSKAATSSPLPA